MSQPLVGRAQSHVPVLLGEVLENLLTSGSGIYVDATFGRGGHSRALLEKLDKDGRVIALDRDPQAYESGLALAASDQRLTVRKARFSELGRVLAEEQVDAVQGVLMDVGVSSPQLDDAERGFSFADGPLDMRMDPESGEPASVWLNQAEEGEIARVLRQHGEERFAKRIAAAIVANRPIERTQVLAELVADAIPAAVRRKSRKHPATKVFQAIRIHINGELEELAQGLQQAFDALAPGGRLAVISFHSLEDRLVKRQFKAWTSPPNLPRRLPVPDQSDVTAARHIAGPVKAQALELAANNRARSAVLRVVERRHGD